MPVRPAGERAAEELDLPAVGHDLPDDLAERERDDADVVAAQAQRRHPDQHAGERRRDDREHEDEQEVEVDAGQCRDRSPRRASETCAFAQNAEPKYAATCAPIAKNAT